ncbi:hypothetical protein SAMN04488498_102121 [Mesorhizobium albiziae]|uniref:Uncharacterized protein n=1 Tax=Neomesorhizobium albiziae TaxID=335020 RepID=A0A1I3WBX4_9HYPH|nr:hypothetical protein [Mesorhizobium albiziae]GLS31524.1 hypothetical protein GCM10007937_32340 [Mesorhizobium albiziae]SFK05164.1 hypothetical protein SAMN04488498_102121 [Mesorhizobium albiziae]
MSDARIFVIGDSKSGLYLIKTNPVKVVRLTRAAIEQYAQSQKRSYEDIFGLLAARTRQIINLAQANPPPVPEGSDFFETLGMTVTSGTTISDAEFCFVADIENQLYQSTRHKLHPIKDALIKLNTGPSGDEEADFDK